MIALQMSYHVCCVLLVANYQLVAGFTDVFRPLLSVTKVFPNCTSRIIQSS